MPNCPHWPGALMALNIPRFCRNSPFRPLPFHPSLAEHHGTSMAEHRPGTDCTISRQFEKFDSFRIFMIPHQLQLQRACKSFFPLSLTTNFPVWFYSTPENLLAKHCLASDDDHHHLMMIGVEDERCDDSYAAGRMSGCQSVWIVGLFWVDIWWLISLVPKNNADKANSSQPCLTFLTFSTRRLAKFGTLTLFHSSFWPIKPCLVLLLPHKPAK